MGAECICTQHSVVLTSENACEFQELTPLYLAVVVWCWEFFFEEVK